MLDDVLFASTVEHRRRDRDAVHQIAGELHHLLIVEVTEIAAAITVGVDALKFHPDRTGLLILLILTQHLVDLTAKIAAGPAEMGLKDLADIHARWHAQRIEHDIDMGAVFEMGHVLDRRDLGDHTLIAMTAGHLVARLQLALHRDEHLDHLQDARRQLVAALQLFDLVVEALFEMLQAIIELALELLDLHHDAGIIDADLPPLALGKSCESLGGDTVLPLGSSFGPLVTERPSNSSPRRP